MGCRWGLCVVAQQFHVTIYCKFTLRVYAFRIDGERLLRISGSSPKVFRRFENIENASWVVLGRFWAVLKCAWGGFRRSWGGLKAVLMWSWADLDGFGLSWSSHGAVWGDLGMALELSWEASGLKTQKTLTVFSYFLERFHPRNGVEAVSCSSLGTESARKTPPSFDGVF